MQNLQFDDAFASIRNELTSTTGKLKIAIIIALTVLVIAIFKIRIWKPEKRKKVYSRARRYYRRYRRKRR